MEAGGEGEACGAGKAAAVSAVSVFAAGLSLGTMLWCLRDRDYKLACLNAVAFGFNVAVCLHTALR